MFGDIYCGCKYNEADTLTCAKHLGDGPVQIILNSSKSWERRGGWWVRVISGYTDHQLNRLYDLLTAKAS